MGVIFDKARCNSALILISSRKFETDMIDSRTIAPVYRP
jgi:hypothetical protein